ncbi:MgtC/SapB family protein (plasmid) [Nicoliella spurrieriana]|uniref:MgtC/SapB family protein n=1 Tax=Nicoliella spurrieriana TaxID=2925830 RepID=A0A976RQR7_9LACO|nr:MgtC/SapB family protein [Nicoliella spurrieriana]UQS86062.1 MgtC/SapB family protein [Nicoliella spurrieriana]
MMNATLEWSIRLFIAMLCGGMIGYERSKQLKSAGIRTHMVVAVGAALTTIVSKYGFYDLIMVHNISIDPTRIAAQIVSGISFIGAGTIITNKNRISGLTTAAGVWVTAAIGMTEGAGLYLIGIIATIMIVLIQFLLHDDSILNLIMPRVHIRMQIRVMNQPGIIQNINNALQQQGIQKISVIVVSIDDQYILVQTDGVVNHRKNTGAIVMKIQRNENVDKVSFMHE